MDLASARHIGAGLAMTGFIGAGIGVGLVFNGYLQAAIRNPAAAAGQFGTMMLGMALAEAAGILAFVMGFIILYA